MRTVKEIEEDLVALHRAHQDLLSSFQSDPEDWPEELTSYLREECYDGLSAADFVERVLTVNTHLSTKLHDLTHDVLNFNCRWSKDGCGTDLGS